MAACDGGRGRSNALCTTRRAGTCTGDLTSLHVAGLATGAQTSPASPRSDASGIESEYCK